MPSVLGHSLVGVSIACVGLRAGRRGPSCVRAVLGVAIGLAGATWADLEGLGDALSRGMLQYASHRSALHSLSTAVVAGVVLAELAVWFRIWSRRYAYPIAVLAACSHPVLDWANGGWGVPLLWPLLERRFSSPWPVLGSPPVALWGTVAMKFLAWDLAVFLPVTIASALLCRARAANRNRRLRAVIALALCAFSLVMLAVSHYAARLS